ncbi:MAG: type VI secretion system tip protein VgrG, partial [Arcobacter sp.]
VEKEKISTVQEDYELHVLKDFNTIVKNDIKTIDEENVQITIRNILLEYVEKDVSDKYLENLFIQIGNEMGVDISDGFHLDTGETLYQAGSEVNFEAASGITLKCGGHVLTVDGSGIHFKTPNYVENSGNSGVSAKEVPKVLIEKAIKKLNIEKIFFSE